MRELETLWRYDLRKGSSGDPRNGACLYDAANWIVHGRTGDSPSDACPVIRAYAIPLNDLLPTAERQKLKRFILRVVGNRDRSSEPARARFLVENVRRRVLSRALGNDATHARESKTHAERDCAGARPLVFVMADVVAKPCLAGAEDALRHGRWELAAARAARGAWVAALAGRCTGRERKVYAAAIETLDGALAIGRQADPFGEAAVRQAVARFARARNRSGTPAWLQ